MPRNSWCLFLDFFFISYTSNSSTLSPWAIIFNLQPLQWNKCSLSVSSKCILQGAVRKVIICSKTFFFCCSFFFLFYSCSSLWCSQPDHGTLTSCTSSLSFDFSFLEGHTWRPKLAKFIKYFASWTAQYKPVELLMHKNIPMQKCLTVRSISD